MISHAKEGWDQEAAAKKLITAAEQGYLRTRWSRKEWLITFNRLPEVLRNEIRDRVWWVVPEGLREHWRRGR